jgi:hypothetical protein
LVTIVSVRLLSVALASLIFAPGASASPDAPDQAKAHWYAGAMNLTLR